MLNYTNEISFDDINKIAYASENDVSKILLNYFEPEYSKRISNINDRANEIVKTVRKSIKSDSPIENLLQEYELNTKEGTVLLCLAEALLRIPDKKTMDRLLEDKFASVDWRTHIGADKGVFVNASSWAFFLTGSILDKKETDKTKLEETYKGLIKRSSEPVIRVAVKKAVTILAKQFVFKPTIEDGMKFTKSEKYKKNIFSFDMLGEGARTMLDANRYYEDYINSIHEVGKKLENSNDIKFSNGVSIKISALHPRYERNKIKDLDLELLPKLIKLCELCKEYNIQLCIDAEENYRLILSLKLLEKLSATKSLEGWNGLGLAVQAYQKRAFFVIDWLNKLAKRDNRIINVRLVKGAYWDTEIKLAQELGVPNYPVFTRKSLTDLSWMACAMKLFTLQENIFPQFATHNAYSIAFIEEFGKDKIFEFQRIHGMADKIHDYFNRFSSDNYQKCRIYAPVGEYDDLLPYLMRRLLENGANTSFVNKINDPKLDINEIIKDPLEIIKKYKEYSNPQIPIPSRIYLPLRKNAKGYDLENEFTRKEMENIFQEKELNLKASSIVSGKNIFEESFKVYNPADLDELLGEVSFASDETIKKSIDVSSNFFNKWKNYDLLEKVKIIDKFADLIEENKDHLIKICVMEAGKTIRDSIDDLREAVDFCHYYSSEAIRLFEKPNELKGPTGEKNKLIYEGKGVIFAISPWNFPIAIFTGQIVSSLVTGNTVIAKPAEQTSLIAFEIIKLLFKAGLPYEALQLILGKGEDIGPKILLDDRIKGVVFTGSCETAKNIQNNLSKRDGEIIPLTAETGGLNFMIIDSSALTEQVVDDAIESGFNGAGQRCSALRILAIQDEVYDKTLEMLSGATKKIKVGLPNLLNTDIGSVIDNTAKNKIDNHLKKFNSNIIAQAPLDNNLNGFFVTPTIIEINNITDIKEEVFGPVIHVYKYQANKIEELVQDINSLNYGLTLGIQSRIENTINYIFNNANIGNIYINRNIVGAVVGVQPFGGRGLSGTGPKAGGPNYLMKFVNEKSYSYDTTAAGGNATLFMMSDNQ
ncbi:MAG: Bifunctional protein PutA [Alphaproteobacteria bacterium MarineAlpha5_Bin9]|nr:MAG: Bifunctional protein PutA [Alphaproteobacteria bacterium MarineAlpha5_Bin9]|tara:strand:+ start:27206 stop:30337 length:3132 start_codon:yes stop_codon:yes gene_type:complete